MNHERPTEPREATPSLTMEHATLAAATSPMAATGSAAAPTPPAATTATGTASTPAPTTTAGTASTPATTSITPSESPSGAPLPNGAAPHAPESATPATAAANETPPIQQSNAASTRSAPAVAQGADPARPTAAPPAAEEKPKWVRDGFYLRLVNCSGFTTFRGNGSFGSASISGLGSNSILAIGGSIAPGLVLAGTINGTQVSGEFKGGPYQNLSVTAGKVELSLTEKATASLAQFGALLDWFPSRQSGAHVGIGAGLGMISIVNQIDDSAYYGINGVATLLAGYDWSIAPSWALGFALVGTGSTKASLKHAKTGKNAPYDMGQYSIGVGVSVLYF